MLDLHPDTRHQNVRDPNPTHHTQLMPNYPQISDRVQKLSPSPNSRAKSVRQFLRGTLPPLCCFKGQLSDGLEPGPMARTGAIHSVAACLDPDLVAARACVASHAVVPSSL